MIEILDGSHWTTVSKDVEEEILEDQLIKNGNGNDTNSRNFREDIDHLDNISQPESVSM